MLASNLAIIGVPTDSIEASVLAEAAQRIAGNDVTQVIEATTEDTGDNERGERLYRLLLGQAMAGDEPDNETTLLVLKEAGKSVGKFVSDLCSLEAAEARKIYDDMLYRAIFDNDCPSPARAAEVCAAAGKSIERYQADYLRGVRAVEAGY